MTDRLTLQDPREQYPKPPFPRQPQPVPGEAREMDPKPCLLYTSDAADE